MAVSSELTTVLFDFHATLAWRGDPEAWVLAAEEHAGRGLERDSTTALHSSRHLQEDLSQVWSLARRRDPSCSWDLDAADHRQAFTTVLTKDIGCDAWLAGALYDVMPDQWRLYDDVPEVLTSLHGAGKRLGIVSNIGIDIRPRLDTLGILQFFGSVVLSYEVGLTKPDPAIFTLALQETGSTPSRTLMVGDTWDQDGAAAAIGISTLILPIKGQPAKGLNKITAMCRV